MKVAKIEARVGGFACMVGRTVPTLGNVVTRCLTDNPFACTEDISVFLPVVTTLARAASVAGRDDHIWIEYFRNGDSETRRRRLRILAVTSVRKLFGEDVRPVPALGVAAHVSNEEELLARRFATRRAYARYKGQTQLETTIEEVAARTGNA